MNGPDISTANMLLQLLVGTLMIILTVALHGAGLFTLDRVLGLEKRVPTRITVRLASPSGVLFTLVLVLTIFALHGIEIWIYALLYWAVEALPTLARSVYFSTITYGTIGYDDEGVIGSWQLVAALEGLNGIILLGWSTAFLVMAVSRISRDGG